MKKIGLTLISLLPFVNMVAQNNYFEKSILWSSSNSGQEIWQIEPKSDGNYALLGHAGGVTNSANYSFFWEIDANGEEINPPVYYQQGDTNLYAAKMLRNELGYAIAQNEDPDNWGDTTGYMVFLQVDEHGQKIFEHKIGDTTRYNVVTSMVRTTEDNGYLFVGRITINNYHRPYLIKLNSNGEKQWEKIIDNYDPNLDSRLYDIVRNEEGYFAVGTINSAPDIALGLGDIILAKIDITNGSFIQDWVYDFNDYYNTNSKDWGRNLLALDDGGFIISGAKETVPQYGYVIRLNSNKEIVWFNDSTNYDCGVTKTIPLPDGSFVVSGCATVLYPEVSNGVQVELSKVSSAGASLWKRHYGVDGYDDYAWDMISTPDGGFMVVGRSYSFFWQQVPIYLLKTNCMGLLTLPQASFVTQIDTGALRASFYNTSQFVYPDSIDGGHYLWQFGDGAISTELNPTHTYTQGSNYTVTLTAIVCSDTSVFVQEVSTWAVGIDASPQPHASPQPTPKEGEMQGLFSITPNPATNQAVAHLPPLLCANSGRLQLLSVTGKLLQSIPYAAKQQTVAFSVAHLPAGIYFVQVGNAVQKLVVE